jgi:hypothetical protein
VLHFTTFAHLYYPGSPGCVSFHLIVFMQFYSMEMWTTTSFTQGNSLSSHGCFLLSYFIILEPVDIWGYWSSDYEDYSVRGWHMAPCSLVGKYWCTEDICCLHRQVRIVVFIFPYWKIESARTSETLVFITQITWHPISETAVLHLNIIVVFVSLLPVLKEETSENL